MTDYRKAWPAILLVGPSGCGKTPLGDLLEAKGIRGMGFRHFDFGKILRESVGKGSGFLTDGERTVVREVLERGALLEDEHFPIAGKLLAGFIDEAGTGADSVIVLNGLPRHIGQAMAIEGTARVQAVVSLDCAPDIAWERVNTNAGGDRHGRSDDTMEQIRYRFRIFRQRTAPLLEYYRRCGVPLVSLDVKKETTAEDMLALLEARYPLG